MKTFIDIITFKLLRAAIAYALIDLGRQILLIGRKLLPSKDKLAKQKQDKIEDDVNKAPVASNDAATLRFELESKTEIMPTILNVPNPELEILL